MRPRLFTAEIERAGDHVEHCITRFNEAAAIHRGNRRITC